MTTLQLLNWAMNQLYRAARTLQLVYYRDEIVRRGCDMTAEAIFKFLTSTPEGEQLIRETNPRLLKEKARPTFLPKILPNSLWLVVYECLYTVVKVSPSGDTFFAPGQEAEWHLDAVTEWVQEIVPGGAKCSEVMVEECYVVKSITTGKYARMEVPEYPSGDWSSYFDAELKDAAKFENFDDATKMIDDYTDPEEHPIVEKYTVQTSFQEQPI